MTVRRTVGNLEGFIVPVPVRANRVIGSSDRVRAPVEMKNPVKDLYRTQRMFEGELVMVAPPPFRALLTILVTQPLNRFPKTYLNHIIKRFLFIGRGCVVKPGGGAVLPQLFQGMFDYIGHGQILLDEILSQFVLEDTVRKFLMEGFKDGGPDAFPG
jgi:hypothetical protein